jgi:hypothetical protein
MVFKNTDHIMAPSVVVVADKSVLDLLNNTYFLTIAYLID